MSVLTVPVTKNFFSSVVSLSTIGILGFVSDTELDVVHLY